MIPAQVQKRFSEMQRGYSVVRDSGAEMFFDREYHIAHRFAESTPRACAIYNVNSLKIVDRREEGRIRPVGWKPDNQITH